MPRNRSLSGYAPAAMLAVLLGAGISSCRPAADPGPEMRLNIRTQPEGVRAGVPAEIPAAVEVLDRDGQLIMGSAMTIRASVVSGAAQVVSGGEASVVGGLATFSGLVVNGTPGANVRLGFQLIEDGVANSEAVITADTFRLAIGPAARVLAKTSTSFSGTPGQIVAPSPSVLVTDPAGNPVAGEVIDFEVLSGEGRITGAAQATSDAQGIATVSGWALGLPGTNRLLAKARTTLQDRAALEVTFQAEVTTTAGMLRIRLTGSPAGSTARVRVLKTSATGSIHDVIYDVRDSLTVTGLPFGTYQVSGDSLKIGSRIWLADGTATGLTVGATSAPSISLNYREHGRFEITTRGLPGAQSAIVDFLPTAGFPEATLFAVTVLNDAVTRSLGPIGTYDVVPRLVSVGGQQFAASPARQSVVLSGGTSVPQLTINYAVTTGTLVVTLAGTLPEGAAPQIDVTGPGGFRETVFVSGGTRTWTGLIPGSYTIVASPITVAGTLFRPTPPTSVVAVTAGNPTPVTITYNP